MKPILLLFVGLILLAQPEDSASIARRAGELVVAGKLDEAIALYVGLAKAHPNDAGIWLNLSIAEFKAKRYRDAASHASASLKVQPDSLGANLFLGSSYEELGEHLLAVEPLKKVLAARPQDRNARLMLAETFLNLDRYQEAEVHFQETSKLAPQNPKVWYGLGRTYEALAENVLHQMEGANPESPYWHALAGDLSLKQRRYGSAFTNYRLALDGRVTLAGVHAGLATVYKRTGHADWAAIAEQRERKSAPDCATPSLACDYANRRFNEIVQSTKLLSNPEARYWTYRAYLKMADEAYGRLLQLPPSLQSHLHKAKALDNEGLSHEAAEEWREALKLASGDLRIETALAWSLFRAREFAAARPVLAEMLHDGTGSYELQFLYGAVLTNLYEPEKAIAPLQEASRLNDRFLPAHAALGQALLQTGKPELAIPHLKAALAADDDATIHFALLRAYQLTGRTELAVQAKVDYEKALKATETRERLEESGAIIAP